MSFILLVGPPGSGKTTLAASMTKLGYKVKFIDVDQKVDKMLNLKPLLTSGMIKVIPIEAKLTEVNMKQRILTPQLAFAKQPKGYLEYCDIITSFEDLISKGQPEPDDCQVLVTDSWTSLAEHQDRLISFLQKKDHFTFDEWDIVLTNWEEWFYTMVRLQKLFKHVIITAHEQIEKDEDSGRVLQRLPAARGSIRFKTGKYFEEIYFCFTEASKTGPTKYKILTAAVDKTIARTSRKFETVEEADFSVLFADELPPEKRLGMEKLKQIKKEGVK